MKSPKDTAEKLELHSDAWARFERVTGVVAKSPPQHRVKEKPKVKKAAAKKTKKAAK